MLSAGTNPKRFYVEGTYQEGNLLALVLWREHLPNFEKCLGVAKKIVVGKKLSSKNDGFRDIAAAEKKSSKRRFHLEILSK
ncbi:hypothetical protein F442_13235 [Phytophthora nicotianae P10297]|uniref:Uncharacterized protein n=1 Tax=Phytophthora nicotianae P10297 TaxID=1317064 RepID=W2YZB8_PHYNI|nr:hypothetical protein F442_13235 [Phytophthora nicotianae P10297]